MTSDCRYSVCVLSMNFVCVYFVLCDRCMSFTGLSIVQSVCIWSTSFSKNPFLLLKGEVIHRKNVKMHRKILSTDNDNLVVQGIIFK